MGKPLEIWSTVVPSEWIDYTAETHIRYPREVTLMREPVLGAALAQAEAHAALPRPDTAGAGVRQLPTSAGTNQGNNPAGT